MNVIIILFVTAIIVLFAGLYRQRNLLQFLSIAGILLAMAYSACGCSFLDDWTTKYNSMLLFDTYARGFTTSALVVSALIMGLSGFSLRNLLNTVGDNLALFLFSLCGAVVMFSFNNIVMLFLGIEILSIPLYVLAGSRRDDLRGNEAALKYFLMGAFATGIFLFGTALVYGATATFDIQTIGNSLALHKGDASLVHAGIALVLIGFSFKVSAAPFHFWAPDVYQGSPNLVTLFMSTLVKIAGFAAFYRLFSIAYAPEMDTWGPVVAMIAVMTMVISNFSAIFQKSFKRMMAYSGISHAGYLMLGILSIGVAGSAGAMFLYITTYAIATIIAFAVFILISEQQGDEQGFSAFNGLGKSHPYLAAAMAVSMLTLAGIPPTAGFFGKYFLFSAAFERYPWLVVVAVLHSAISIYYYFKILAAMYFTDDMTDNYHIQVPVAYKVVIAVAVALLVLLSVVPGSVLRLVG